MRIFLATVLACLTTAILADLPPHPEPESIPWVTADFVSHLSSQSAEGASYASALSSTMGNHYVTSLPMSGIKDAQDPGGDSLMPSGAVRLMGDRNETTVWGVENVHTTPGQAKTADFFVTIGPTTVMRTESV